MKTNSTHRRPKFVGRNVDFSHSVKQAVRDYLKETTGKKTGNRVLYTKAAILGTLFVGLYSTLVWLHPTHIVGIILCVLFGLTLGAIGFNIMHDACHESFSSRPWVNRLFGLSLNLIGGNSDWWIQKHNTFHHTYTNIPDADEDIAIPFIRAHPEQPRHWYHRYQHWYWPVMYSLTYLAWIYVGDFQKYFSGKIGPHAFPIKPAQHLVFWISKLLYAAIFIVVPLMNYSLWEFLVGYFIVLGVCGLFIAIIFQLAHLVEDVQHPVPVGRSIENEWAIHQVQTTANFGTQNNILFWICGGLNFQIEHHLFPDISHVYYRALQPIVKQKCEEYGIAYNEKPSLLHAIRSHVATLKKLGTAS